MNAHAGPPSPERILIVHNAYQVRGGEDVVVENEAAALRRAGRTVETLILSNDVIRTSLDRLRVAAQATQAPAGIAAVLAAAERFRPDVVHVHNTFPLISPAVHGALRARTRAATVQTLHNYRITCAGGTLMRDGAPCEDCVTGSPYNGARHACYRGSRLGSLAVARMIAHHRARGTWRRDVDRFIALTEFARALLVLAGVPADRITVKPNGLPDPGPPDVERVRAGILFVGRLSPEKGPAVLAAAAARGDVPIEVIGEGPGAEAFAGLARATLHGALGRAAVSAAMARAVALVVPSLWYEGLPLVIAEAFAAGTPVIASRIGALRDLVTHGVTGLLVEPGDPGDLARAMGHLTAHPEQARRMGLAARAAFERDWVEPVTTAALLAVYAAAWSRARLRAVP